MGTSLAQATMTERWQALQQLEAAYGPVNDMVFTYNGVTYRSMGTNADGTLNVINQSNGQVSVLDPINIYGSAMVATGTPVITQPTVIQPPLTPQSSIVGNIQSYGGILSPMLSGVAQFFSKMALKSMSNVIPNLNALDPTQDYVLNTSSDAIAHMGTFGKLYSVFGKIAALAGIALGSMSIYQSISGMFQSGKISGMQLFNIASSSLGVAMGANAFFLHAGFLQSITNPAGWYFAGAVIAGSILAGSINQMVLNGPSVKMSLIAAGSFFGTAVLTNLALEALHLFGVTSAFGPIGWAVAAAVLAFTVLWALFHQPPPEQVAAQNLTGAISPVVWVQGPLAVVAVGTVAMLMGWAKNTTPPIMASLTVPAYYVNQVLASQGVSNIDLKSKTPSMLVEPGDGRVVIVSPNGYDRNGNPLVTLQTYALDKNLQFVSSPNAPPEGTYIPFFAYVNGHLQTKPSAQVTQALTLQQKMLDAVINGGLLTHDALNALNIAAAANKLGITPTSNN